MKYLYRVYLVLIAVPVAAVATVLTSFVTIVGCALGNGDFWGYYPAKLWSRCLVRLSLVPITVTGREHLKKGQSYVFVCNHQGVFEIFLIYGYLNRNFKWMMKHQIRNIPFIGVSCAAAHHIFVDKRGPSRIKKTYDEARKTLQGGMSLAVFPEGSRSFTGHMGVFRRGAFMLADDLQLPVVPLTVNGSFDIKPRTKDLDWVYWHPLSLTIHEPIDPIGKGAENIDYLKDKSYEAVMSGLEPKYQGFVENPDQ